MIKLTMLNTREELMELTGLDESTLWDMFDLDDWDVGFCADRKLTYTAFDEDCGEWQEPFDYSYWLVRAMENYCVGYEYVEYNGKHYYLVHHA